MSRTIRFAAADASPNAKTHTKTSTKTTASSSSISSGSMMPAAPPKECIKVTDFDDKIVYEFGGPFGVTCIMLFAPCMMWYFWACLEHNEGRMITTGVTEEWSEFFTRLQGFLVGAAPSSYGFKIYTLFVLLQAVLAWFMPGPIVKVNILIYLITVFVAYHPYILLTLTVLNTDCSVNFKILPHFTLPFDLTLLYPYARVHSSRNIYGSTGVADRIRRWQTAGLCVQWSTLKPLPRLQGTYSTSQVTSFYATIVISAGLHLYGVFPLTDLIDNWGMLLLFRVVLISFARRLCYIFFLS